MEEDLINKAKNGDKEAFTNLILEMQGQLYKVAKTRLRYDDDIYDVLQETVIESYQSIKKLKHNEYFKTWITRILINKCNYLFKKKYRRKEIFYDDISVNNYCIQPDDEVLDFEFMCKNLKYEDRIIIILYYMNRYTDKEIGEILKIKESTVKTKRNRAKSKIKKIVEGEK